jgi:hypothetical protein
MIVFSRNKTISFTFKNITPEKEQKFINLVKAMSEEGLLPEILIIKQRDKMRFKEGDKSEGED